MVSEQAEEPAVNQAVAKQNGAFSSNASGDA
jgi:hypothetical protein